MTATSRRLDVIATMVLIGLLGAGGLFSLVVGLFLGMAAATCSDEACTDRVSAGVLVLELAPIVAWVPTTAWAVVRMSRGRVAWWVPLLALPVYVALAAAGLSIIPL